MTRNRTRRNDTRTGLGWWARNSVVANLLMLFFLVGGFLFALQIKQEVFPEITLDIVTISVPYPGATPTEVEEGVVLAVEEAARGVDGVKEVRAVAVEGQALVTVELRTSADRQLALDDIQSAVDRITSFPQDVERPVVSLATNRREVVSVVFHGDLDPATLDELAERARDELLATETITVIEVGGVPPPEISIEVPQKNLRRYGLTLQQIAAIVDAATVEIPGGSVDTPGGDVLLRTSQRRKSADAYRDIAVLSRPDGTEVRLGDIATVIDGYRDIDREAYFNGKRAVQVKVFRVGEQTPLDISEEVRDYVERTRETLPPAVQVAVWNDFSEIYRDRINMLLKNAALGLVLVIFVLGLFLHVRLAFWVTLGIPVTFLGAFIFATATDVSINMISLFAFLLALGIVVDDAIVVGEAIYKHRRDGKGPLQAAVDGVREVAVPVTLSVLTTVIAFVPMLFVAGVGGKFFRNIPLIVIPILLLSLVESLFILPAHLAHGKQPTHTGRLGRLAAIQERFSAGLERFIVWAYRPTVRAAVALRYTTLASAIGVLAIAASVVAGRHITFEFMPKIEGDVVVAQLEMPFGTPVEQTRTVMNRLVGHARAVLEEAGGEERLSRGILAHLGQSGVTLGGTRLEDVPDEGGHLAEIALFLVPAGEREISASAVTRRWRERAGEIAGVETLTFSYSVGPPAGAPVAIELRHPDLEILEAAAEKLAAVLATYEGVFDVDEGFKRGKEQLELELKPAARAFGISERELALQVRGAFFGAEALREQRGRDELRVYVRRPESERTSKYDVENLIIRTPQGGEIPLDQTAWIRHGRSFTEIQREGGSRAVTVTGDVESGVTSGGEIIATLERDVLPRLLEEYRGLSYELGGEQEFQTESLDSLKVGMSVAVVAMFALMAGAFRSYTQPLIIMFAIPFGVVGAIGGHLLMGFDLSLISLLGMVALAGVVVNDSLVLIDVVNDNRRHGMPTEEALVAAGMRRFRPILLTSVTTFFGLAPMIFETSLQGRFLIPMAISLGFGVLFATAITLVLVPSTYMVLDDVQRLARRGGRRVTTVAKGGPQGPGT